MMFEQLRHTTTAIASYSDRRDDQGLLREQSDRIDRHYRSGELTFREWAGLMATLLRPAGQNRADAVA
jgi:hypothetical protein